ncbi:hypothetical protein BSKO_01178 [Bryopsis sp. KO-2023]|nr:hypothetical protein BSKO_01178 [Bryopsis sp. KO-2023]
MINTSMHLHGWECWGHIAQFPPAVFTGRPPPTVAMRKTSEDGEQFKANVSSEFSSGEYDGVETTDVGKRRRNSGQGLHKLTRSIDEGLSKVTGTLASALPTQMVKGIFKGVSEGLSGVKDSGGPTMLGKSLAELLESDPSQLLHVISKHGVKKLGEFKIKEDVMKNFFKSKKVVTLRSNYMDDIDWKSMWNQELNKTRCETGKGATVYREVEAYVVTIRDAAGWGRRGILRPITLKWESGGCPQNIFSAPALQAVVSYKWHQWAKKVLWLELLLFIGWLFSFLAFGRLYSPDDLSEWWWETVKTGDRGRLSVITCTSSMIFMLPFAYISICEILMTGLGRWFGFWNITDAAAEVMQVICFILHMSNSDVGARAFDIILATQTVLLVTKIQYFCRAFTQVKTAFIDALIDITKDIVWFLVFVFLNMFSFALALYILFRKNRYDFVEYSSIWHSFITLYSSMFKRFSFDPYLKADNMEIVVPVFSFFLFLNTITLFNLLISILISTHKKVANDPKSLVVSSRAQMITELESGVPHFLVKRFDAPYVHFLRVLPPSDIKTVWQEIGHAENAAENQKLTISNAMDEAEKTIMEHIEVLSQEIEMIKSKY